jgi:hypothetical protein
VPKVGDFQCTFPRVKQSLIGITTTKPFAVCPLHHGHLDAQHDRIVLAIYAGVLAAKPIAPRAFDGGGPALSAAAGEFRYYTVGTRDSEFRGGDSACFKSRVNRRA